MSIKLIVGLENPGENYAKTRHNAGGWFIRSLLSAHALTLKTEKSLQAMVADWQVDANQKIRLAIPMTFMNHSGQALTALAHFYKLSPDAILVAHDDLDVDVGRVKLKTGGGHGGHNGLRDIIQHIGADFHRLRVGIGHPGEAGLVHDYVLTKPSVSDKIQIEEALLRTNNQIDSILTGNFASAMNQLHTRTNHGT